MKRIEFKFFSNDKEKKGGGNGTNNNDKCFLHNRMLLQELIFF